jgi:hypothetical protein
MFITKNF